MLWPVFFFYEVRYGSDVSFIVRIRYGYLNTSKPIITLVTIRAYNCLLFGTYMYIVYFNYNSYINWLFQLYYLY